MEAVDSDLGEALGQKYVELAFAGDSKERMLKMVKGLEAAMEKDIRQIDWMTPETKEAGARKTARDYGQDRISRQMARLFVRQCVAQRRVRQQAAGRCIRESPQSGQDRQGA